MGMSSVQHFNKGISTTTALIAMDVVMDSHDTQKMFPNDFGVPLNAPFLIFIIH